MFRTRFIIITAALAAGAAAAFSPNGWAGNGACCPPAVSSAPLCCAWECEGQGGVWHGDLRRCSLVDCGAAPLECPLAGGGVDASGRGDGAFANGFADTNRNTFGGRVTAPTASQPQPPAECARRQQSGPDGDSGLRAGTASAPAQTEIAIHRTADSGSTIIYEVRGYITGGNLQIHPPIG